MSDCNVNSLWSFLALVFRSINANYMWFFPVCIAIILAYQLVEYKLGKTTYGSVIGFIIKLLKKE